MTTVNGDYLGVVGDIKVYTDGYIYKDSDGINVGVSANFYVYSYGFSQNVITGKWDWTGGFGGDVKGAVFIVGSDGSVSYGLQGTPVTAGIIKYADGTLGLYGGASLGPKWLNVSIQVDSNLNGSSNFLQSYNHIIVTADGHIQQIRYFSGDSNYPYVKVEVTQLDKDGDPLGPPIYTSIGDSDLAAAMAAGLASQELGRNSFFLDRCFAANTFIQLPDGLTAPISTLTIGDTVLAFDTHAPRQVATLVASAAPLVPARVTKLFTNVTDEWLVVRPALGHEAQAAANGFTELTVTPGHEMLDAYGRFRKVIDILNSDARLMLADGQAVSVEYARVVYSAATADLYEQAEVLVHATSGNLALQPEVKRGWKTYNFEVEHYHTYIAGGIRVHNDSVFTASSPEGHMADQIIDQINNVIFADDPLQKILIGSALKALGSVAADVAFSNEVFGIDLIAGRYAFNVVGSAGGYAGQLLMQNILDGLHITGPVGDALNIFASGVGTNLAQQAFVTFLHNSGDPLLASHVSDMLGQGISFNSIVAGPAFAALGSLAGAELSAWLHLDPAQAQVLTATTQAMVQQIGLNLLSTDPTVGIFDGVTAAGLGAFAGAAGGYVANLIGHFDTPSEQLGEQIGSSIGSFILSGFGPLGTFVGSLVGGLIGGLIGSLFDEDPPPPQHSYATLSYHSAMDNLLLSDVHGNSTEFSEALRNIANSHIDAIKQVITAVGGEVINDVDYSINYEGQVLETYHYDTNIIGVTKKIIDTQTVDFSMGGFHDGDPQNILALGVLQTIHKMLLAGGDHYVVRAILATFAKYGLDSGGNGHFDLATAKDLLAELLGNITIAQNFETYLKNAETINAAIAADPKSEFAVGWLITLKQVYALGIQQHAASDWIGGFEWLLHHDNVRASDMYFSHIDQGRWFVESNGTAPHVVGDSISSGDKDTISGGDSNDYIVVNGDTFDSTHSISGTTNGFVAFDGFDKTVQIGFAANIYAGAGNDIVYGGDLGNDIFGGAGNDVLTGGKLDDWLDGGSGNDILYAGGGNGDVLNGGDGNDWLLGDTQEDWLIGGAGDDILSANDGDDILEGGSGRDILDGGKGGDTYIFRADSGVDLISDTGSNGIDVVDFAKGVLASDLVVRRSANGSDIIVTINGNASSMLVISGMLLSENSGVEKFEFSNGTVWTRADILAAATTVVGAGDTLTGTYGVETIVGTMSADDISSGAGNDILKGGFGGDTYHFNLGDGQDLIVDLGLATNLDSVVFGAGIFSTGFTVERDPLDTSILTLNFNGTDKLSIKYGDSNFSDGVEQFVFADGKVLTATDLQQKYLQEHTSGVIIGGLGNEIITDGEGDDTLRGGGGHDTLVGNAGNDRFEFNMGDGDVHVNDWGLYNSIDTVVLGAGITPSNIQLNFSYADGYFVQNITVSIPSTGDRIEFGIDLHLERGVDRLEFADGTVWTKEQIAQHAIEAASTVYNDTIYGFEGNDIVNGGLGDDRITTISGDDDLAGGKGVDYLAGGAGDDTYHYNLGDGNDTFAEVGGSGFGNGSDTVIFGAGILANEVTVSRDAVNPETVYFKFKNGDVLTIVGGFGAQGFYGTVIENYHFADGTVWDQLAILTHVDATATAKNNYFETGSHTFNIGDGYDHFVGSAIYGGSLTFGTGITKSNITLSLADSTSGLKLSINGTSDAIFLQNITSFSFADGSSLSSEGLYQLYIDQHSTRGDDYIDASNFWKIYQAGLTINSGAGDDYILGAKGDDNITGGTGDDYADGGYSGNDTYKFSIGDGHDRFDGGYGFSDNDTVLFGNGIVASDLHVILRDTSSWTSWLTLGISNTNDTIALLRVEWLQFSDGTRISTADFLLNHPLSASDTSENVVGTGQDDMLLGTLGNDTLKGLTGNDTLVGGRGSDTFTHAKGEGVDTIVEGADAASFDVVLFGGGITKSQIAIEQSPDNINDLILRVLGTDDTIVLKGQLLNDGSGVEQLQFADGTVWNRTDFAVTNPSAQATIGDDTIYGNYQNNLLEGGLGNDLLIGGLGADTYTYSLGGGNDVIVDKSGTQDSDVLSYGFTFSAATITWSLAPDKLSLVVGVNGSSTTIQNEFAGDGEGVEFVNFTSGESFSRNAIQDLIIQGMSTSGNDTVKGFSGSQTLSGGLGVDFLDGSLGADTYSITIGAGDKTILDSGLSSDVDILQLGNGIVSTSLTITRDGAGSYKLSDATNSWSATLVGGMGGIEKITFNDGTLWTQTNIEQYFYQHLALSGNGTIYGNDTAETLTGSNLADAVYGGGGNDTIYGGAENDRIYGQAGDDTLYGDAGDDTFQGGLGLDKYFGGSGIDTVDMSYSPANWIVDLTLGIAKTADNPTGIETLDGIENLIGGSGNDSFMGDTSANRFEGGTGNDKLNGGQGDDLLIGGVGSDVLIGGSGIDTADYKSSSLGVTIDLRFSGIAQVSGGDANGDTLTDVENLVGSKFNDILTGNGAANTIEAGAGDDQLVGGLGNDTLSGQHGNDIYIYARGDGSDTIGEAINGGSDKLILSDLNPVNVTLQLSGSDVLIIIAESSLGAGDGGTITLKDSIGDADSLGVEVVQFANGTIWTQTDFRAMLLGATNDTVNGTSGNDIFQYSRGGGNDTFIDGIFSGTDKIVLGNINPTDVTLVRSGNDVKLVVEESYAGSNDAGSVLLKNSLDDYYVQGVEQIQFANGVIWTQADLRLMLLAQSATTGNDVIVGYNTADTIIGAQGNDMISGADGNDTFIYTRGDGHDTITEGIFGGVDKLLLTNINPGDVSIVRNGYDVTIIISESSLGAGDAGSILLKNSLQDRYSEGVDQIQFANGTVWTPSDLRTMLLTSTSANENFIGFDSNDIYYYSRGGGNDTITEGIFAGTDKLVLTNLNPSDITFLRNGNDLTIVVAESSLGAGDAGSILLKNSFDEYYSEGVDQIQFADGTLWNRVDFANHLGSGNQAPIAALPLSDLSSAEDAAFNFTLPTGSFTDADNPALIYSATLTNGTVLPTWLNFDATSQTFRGTPPQDFNGIIDVKVTASDGSLSATDIFSLTITPLNDAPIVSAHLPDQSSVEDAAFSFALPAGSFSDVDNAILTYTATLANGDALPNWLNFNAAIQSFIGSPPQDFNGNIDVKVTASDGSLSASDVFTLTITPVNDAPIVAVLLPDMSSAEDTAFNFTVPVVSFTDVDNATLTYSATLASGAVLPSWLIFNATTQTFSGTPPLNYNGNIDVKVTATDGNLSASDVFTLVINPVNDAPIAANDGPLSLAYNTPHTVTAASLLANDTDVDSATLTITSVSDPSHGTVVLQGNGSIIFTPDADYIGTASFTYAISDGAGGTATATATINVQGVAGQIINGTAAADTLTGTSGDDTINGLAGNDILNGNGGVDKLVGGLGNDTYIVNSVGDQTIELVNEGTDHVQSSISWTLGANLENLTLTGAANINGMGNSAVNTITGNAGNNILNGAGGLDSLVGGLGDDTYIVDVAGVVTTEAVSAGTDTVQSSVTWTLGANFENLMLTGTAAINGTGNTQANVITGNSADNILNGGTGADTLIGGLGNDIYIVDNIGDTITENTNEGTDLIQSSVSWTMAANIENLTLNGTSAVNGTGNGLNNIINGNTGANMIDGGIGADTMIGGAGNDTYVVDNVGDVTTEIVSGGTDLVQASISWTLASEVENLTLTGAGNINGTGNSVVNRITGNGGNNILNGAGGVDTLIGGLGDDTYIVDVAGVITTEAANAGTDTVQSSVTWTLATNLENLILIGAAAISGMGNTAANVITGNSVNNTLNGGTGADILIGGLGDDTYVVDNVGDVVTELANEGIDLVQASASFVLSAFVESLILTGTTAINGTGNDLANTITGNAGANILDGGLGADTLVGGTGNDTYIVDNVGDVITEAAAAGTDVVKSSINWTLGANLENLTLMGTANTYGAGNTLNNTITGNAGNNVLDGGSGTDTLAGGLGDDIYIVNQTTGLTLTEAVSAGTDTVQSSVTWTLGANFENLMLTGTAAINGTGNTADNILIGNTAVNTLNGGTGNDTLTGGGGNDRLTGGLGNDSFDFSAGFGKDTITDFTAGLGVTDVLHLTLGAAFDTYAEVMAVATQVGANTVITIDAADTITLTNVLKIALVADDFFLI